MTAPRFVAVSLFAVVLIILEAALLMYGRYLRHPSRDRDIQQTFKPRRMRPLPLVVYLAGSIGIGILASLGTIVLPQIKALGFLIGQPNVLTQLIAGGLLGIRWRNRDTRNHGHRQSTLLFSLVLSRVRHSDYESGC